MSAATGTKKEKIDSEDGLGVTSFLISGTAIPGGIYLSSNAHGIWTGSRGQSEAACPDGHAWGFE